MLRSYTKSPKSRSGESQVFCVQCGSSVPQESKFCINCGAPAYHAGGAPSAVVPAAAAVPPPGVQVMQAPAYPGMPQGQPVYYVVPQAAHPGHTVQQMNFLRSLEGRIQNLASTEQLEGFSLKEMFSEVFKKKTPQEVGDYVLVGATKTTPPIDTVETGWPKPWLFFRLLIALVVAYVGLTRLFMWTGNTNCIPGMMFIGSFAIPLATLCLLFEMNTPRNVSLHTIGKLFLFGAVVSLAVALLGYSLPIFQLGTWEAGIVEEVAKLLTVVIVMRSSRYKYILNGILFGATVGAGFACFETAGYALNQGFLPGLLQGLVGGQNSDVATHAGVVAMLQILLLRGILAPMGHVAWTAIAAGAFWRVKKDRPTSPAMLLDVHFLKAFAIPVALHALWDAPDFMQLPFFGNDIITGLISWYVVFGLVQQGLKQVRDEQRSHLQQTLQTVEASMQPAGSVAVS
jgi:RsiW-degrading membrane proteinase PrsW (M82 family)